jgi:hypothetical protein
MGFNRVTWTPGHDRKPMGASRFRGLARLRRQREARARESTAARALQGSLVSLAALLGSEVRDPDDRIVGRLSDVVVHWTTRGAAGFGPGAGRHQFPDRLWAGGIGGGSLVL